MISNNASEVDNLIDCFANGKFIVSFTQLITHQSVPTVKHDPIFWTHRLENTKRSLELLSSQGYSVSGIDPEDLAKGSKYSVKIFCNTIKKEYTPRTETSHLSDLGVLPGSATDISLPIETTEDYLEKTSTLFTKSKEIEKEIYIPSIMEKILDRDKKQHSSQEDDTFVDLKRSEPGRIKERRSSITLIESNANKPKKRRPRSQEKHRIPSQASSDENSLSETGLGDKQNKLIEQTIPESERGQADPIISNISKTSPIIRNTSIVALRMKTNKNILPTDVASTRLSGSNKFLPQLPSKSEMKKMKYEHTDREITHPHSDNIPLQNTDTSTPPPPPPNINNNNNTQVDHPRESNVHTNDFHQKPKHSSNVVNLSIITKDTQTAPNNSQDRKHDELQSGTVRNIPNSTVKSDKYSALNERADYYGTNNRNKLQSEQQLEVEIVKDNPESDLAKIQSSHGKTKQVKVDSSNRTSYSHDDNQTTFKHADSSDATSRTKQKTKRYSPRDLSKFAGRLFDALSITSPMLPKTTIEETIRDNNSEITRYSLLDDNSSLKDTEDSLATYNEDIGLSNENIPEIEDTNSRDGISQAIINTTDVNNKTETKTRETENKLGETQNGKKGILSVEETAVKNELRVLPTYLLDTGSNNPARVVNDKKTSEKKRAKERRKTIGMSKDDTLEIIDAQSYTANEPMIDNNSNLTHNMISNRDDLINIQTASNSSKQTFKNKNAEIIEKPRSSVNSSLPQTNFSSEKLTQQPEKNEKLKKHSNKKDKHKFKYLSHELLNDDTQLNSDTEPSIYDIWQEVEYLKNTVKSHHHIASKFAEDYPIMCRSFEHQSNSVRKLEQIHRSQFRGKEGTFQDKLSLMEGYLVQTMRENADLRSKVWGLGVRLNQLERTSSVTSHSNSYLSISDVTSKDANALYMSGVQDLTQYKRIRKLKRFFGSDPPPLLDQIPTSFTHDTSLEDDEII